MRRKNIVAFLLCLAIAIALGVIYSVSEASTGTISYSLSDSMHIKVMVSEDNNQLASIKALQMNCFNELGYVPKYTVDGDELIVHLWEHELVVPMMDEDTIPNIHFSDDVFRQDNLIRIFPERESKNAYTKLLLEGSFYKIDYQKEADGSVTLICSSKYFGTKKIKTKCMDVSDDEFEQVYFTAKQYRQLEYDLYGMSNK